MDFNAQISFLVLQTVNPTNIALFTPSLSIDIEVCCVDLFGSDLRDSKKHAAWKEILHLSDLSDSVKPSGILADR